MAPAPTAAPAIRPSVPATRIRALGRWLRPHAAVFSTTLLVTGLGWRLAEPLQQWELSLTGLAQEWRGARHLQAPVTIVAIDDYSFQQVANADLSGDPRLARLEQ